MAGIKCATTPSLWSFEHNGDPLPEVGDLNIVTNWAGEAQCIIRTTSVQVLPLDEVGEEHARLEGEGDGTLRWWRETHWAYYYRELAGTRFQPRADMLVVFETFECVYPGRPGA